MSSRRKDGAASEREADSCAEWKCLSLTALVL